MTISAIHSATTKSAVLTVQAPTATNYVGLMELANSNQTQVALTGGSTATVTVYINTSAARNTTVNLTSSNTAAATVPATITVAKGTSSNNFTVTTSSVTSAKDVLITATCGGTVATFSVIVLPSNGVAVGSVSLYPSSVGGGSPLYGAGTVTLTGPAPTGGATVTLTGSRANIISIQGYAAGGGFSSTSTFIAAGGTTGTILAQTYAFTGINRATTITATYGGITRSADLLVTAQPQARLSRHESVQCASLALTPCFMALTPVTNSVGDTSGYYLYTPELHLMAETAISTATSKAIAYSYLWFGDLPVASVDSTNTTRWYATDHLGTPLLMTDASGAVVWRAEHAPYGGIYTYRAGPTLHQPLRLPGQTAQDGNDGYYNIFRWYRSSWGRYSQADPIGLNGGLNLFVYAYDDPANTTDASGLLGDERFHVCCRPVGGVPGASRRVPGRPNPGLHCYVRMFRGDGSSSARSWSVLDISGTAVPGINHLADLQWQQPRWCGSPMCANGAQECLDRLTVSYPSRPYPRFGLGGPNSNTFAHYLSDACGIPTPPQANSVDAPGWNQPVPQS